jgi:hypothetical protein
MQYLKDLFSLQGKSALVTGATRGLGKAIAEALLRAGATVVLNGSNADKLVETTRQFQSEGLAATSFVCDLSHAASVATLAEHVLAELPRCALPQHSGLFCASSRHFGCETPCRPDAQRFGSVNPANAPRNLPFLGMAAQVSLSERTIDSLVAHQLLIDTGSAQAGQVCARLASCRDCLAAIREAANCVGTLLPVPKYISSGVWPRNAECGRWVLC